MTNSGHAESRRLSRAVLGCCVLALVGQAVLLGMLWRSDGTGRPHRVPVAVAAPGVVAQQLVDQVNANPDRPVTAERAETAATARQEVRSGRVVAAVVVDLATTTDRVYLNPVSGDRLNAVVLAEIRAFERSHSRTVEVREVSLGRDAGSSRVAVGAGSLAAYTVVMFLAGFAMVLLVSLRHGPIGPSAGHGARRGVGYAAAALLASIGCLALPAVRSAPDPWLLILLGALSALTGAWLTQALEALAGLAGLAIAAAGLLVLVTPLLTDTDPYLLPSPWPVLAAWTPTGASLDAARGLVLFVDGAWTRPLLVLTGWLLLAGLVWLLSARFQRVGRSSGAHVATVRRRWRLRVGAVVLPTAVLAVVAVLLVPTELRPVAALPDRAVKSKCVQPGRVGSVADLNRIAASRGAGVFRGGDVGADVELQDGRHLWMFGDTLTDSGAFVRNSMLIFARNCAQSVTPAAGGAVVPDRDAEVGYWPMSVNRAERPGYDLVLVALQRVRSSDESDAFGFENLGPAMAIFVVPRGGTPQLITVKDVGPDSADRARPVWGAAATVVGGWAYVYGTATSGAENVFGFSLRVARVRPDDVLDLEKYRYFDGRAWVPDPDRAVELISAEDGTSQTLSVFRQGDTWYALSKRNEFLGNAITVWTAPTPAGPFSAGQAVAPLESDLATGTLRYMPLAHPDLLPRPGTVVVSYSRNNTAVQEIRDDPLRYRPRFLRVRLPAD